MAAIATTEQLEIYKALFKGRVDVFAVRWEKEGKNGYMPAYDLNWDDYRSHKARGGTFQNFSQKSYMPLSDSEIIKHLSGEQLIGIYPLLSDNSSWLIASDFDEANWLDESVNFMNACQEINLPAYIERSRSGNGAHVWLFFEQPYPAIKSRRIMTSLLNRAGIVSEGGSNSSFDRLFPNQDYLSGKGLGNLIALPLHKKSYENGNSCFIDPKTFQPIESQWNFITSIKKIPVEQLEKAYKIVSGNNSVIESSLDKLRIILDNQIHISRAHLPLQLMNFIKKQLDFLNSEFIIKKKSGINTWNTPAHFKLIKETANEIIIPRGLTGKILRFCREQKIEFEFMDNRVKQTSVRFSPDIVLKDFQRSAVEATHKRDLGILSAPPGSGKTVMGLSVIAEKEQPALILVHRRQLADQWKDRIQTFLKIPKHEIGYIGQGETRIGRKITIGMIQSLAGLSDKEEFKNITKAFGIILVDECHHIPAETYRDCIEHFHSYYMYGLTATPFRKSNDEKILFAHMGDVIAEVTPELAEKHRKAAVIIRETKFHIPFNSKTDKVETLMKALVQDSSRNQLIFSDVQMEIQAGRKAIIITERKEHLEALLQHLKQAFEVITLTGDDNESERKRKWKLLHESDFDVLITTGQLFGEGSDLNSVDCLFLIYPFSFEGKLVQYIGRVQRGEFAPVIYDYRDAKIEYLEKLFQKRNSYYQKLQERGTIKENATLILMLDNDDITILGSNQPIKLSALELPDSIERFKSNGCWLIRVLKFDQENHSMFCEILDYEYTLKENYQISQVHNSIRTIRFRSVDTNKLLNSVIMKKQLVKQSSKPKAIKNNVVEREPIEIIQETIKVPISTLEFDYGLIRFTYFSQRLYQQLIFELPNEEMRPEFEVLKPYFTKAFKSKKVNVALRLEIRKDNLISQQATSFDLERINQEIIEGVKFNFVKDVLRRKDDVGSPLNLRECLGGEKSTIPLYSSEQNFIEDILKWKNVKHFYQLKYLAQGHDVSVLKIRFMLMPFSFIFLLTGNKRYHVVLETLDTEEATYIWHIDKGSDSFTQQLEQVDKAITELRSEGRQKYLSSSPENFSRILHDYSDSKKGFIFWKGLIEAIIS